MLKWSGGEVTDSEFVMELGGKAVRGAIHAGIEHTHSYVRGCAREKTTGVILSHNSLSTHWR